MEPDPQRNVGRSKPASKSDFVPAARELVSTPVVTRSDDVCRSSWSYRSRVRESRSSTVIPEIESRPETETEPDVENAAEMGITFPVGYNR